MTLDDISSRPAAWQKVGEHNTEVVVSTRARLARNLAAYPFKPRMSAQDREQVVGLLKDVLHETKVITEGFYVDMLEVDAISRKLMMERHLISHELAEAVGQRGVMVQDDEQVSVMINEEDHVRMQAVASGFAFDTAFDLVEQCDTALSNKLDYAFHPKYGYLTTCTSNAGTGLRASAMLHLPALAITNELEQVFKTISRLNLAVRGFYGEGSAPLGHYYQISNHVTLGKSEREIIDNISAVVAEIAKSEKRARHTLLTKDLTRLSDRIFRAKGLLTSSRILTSEEATVLLSMLRLGVNLDIVKDIDLAKINELVLFSQPAHLQKREKCEIPANERDMLRSEYIRTALGN